MGFFGGFGGFLKKISELGGKAINVIGHIKSGYNKINDLTGGAIGRVLENLPGGVGEKLKMGGKFINGAHTAAEAGNLVNHVQGFVSDRIKDAQHRHSTPPETKKQRDNRRRLMGLENL